MMKHFIHYFSFASILLVANVYAASTGAWDDHYGSATEACKAKVEDPASVDTFSHAEVIGDFARCYTKPRDSKDKSEPSYASVVFYTEKPEAPEAANDNNSSTATDSTTPPPSGSNTPSTPADICKEVTATFNQTMNEELPSSKKNKATVAVGVIVDKNNQQKWVAAASSISTGTDGQLVPEAIDDSDGSLSTSKYDYYAEGISPGQTSFVNRCKQTTKFVYGNSARPLQGHAEAKIIEDWFRYGATGTTLYLKIGGAQSVPCVSCNALIQHVNSGASGDCPTIKLCP